MRTAATEFIGKKDFRSFIVNSSDIDNTVREIETIDIINDQQFIYFIFLGDGFLYKMIRTIVGTIIDVGRGNLKVDAINQIFIDQDRQSAKDTVPARGLYLDKVFY
jgi:tRNA pseudouridine38-40 synthase